MTAVTAKIKVHSKNEFLSNSYGSDPTTVSEITFIPNYSPGVNEAWASATPSLTYKMTVKADVAKRFSPGQAFTVTLESDDE